MSRCKRITIIRNNYILISRKEEGGGYCSVWSVMAELILANPKLDTSEILDILFKCYMIMKSMKKIVKKNTI